MDIDDKFSESISDSISKSGNVKERSHLDSQMFINISLGDGQQHSHLSRQSNSVEPNLYANELS